MDEGRGLSPEIVCKFQKDLFAHHPLNAIYYTPGVTLISVNYRLSVSGPKQPIRICHEYSLVSSVPPTLNCK